MHAQWRTIPGFIRIGATGKTRGIDGELKLYVDEHFLPVVLESEYVFLDRDGSKVPLAIEALRVVQDILVKFENVDDPSEANAWANLQVYLPSDEVTEGPSQAGETDLQFHDLKGFLIVDQTLGSIGPITEVRDFPQQEMAVVDYNGHEVLIPLNVVFIKKINNLDKVISMNLPEGILDL